MNIFLNIIWFVFGGLMVAVEYAISSVAMDAYYYRYSVWPADIEAWPKWHCGRLGQKVVDDGWPSGCLAGVMNVVWWFVGGVPIALTHMLWGLIFCVTVVGIPFGMQHFKLMKLALFPFGTKVS